MKNRMVVWMAIAASVACGCSHSTKKGDLSLTSVRWSLTELNGKKVQPEDNFYLRFDQKEHRVNGKGDCNLFMGSYTLSGKEGLVFDAMASTRAFCPNQELENEFIEALNGVTGYAIKGDALTLMDDGEAVAVFNGEPETQTE